jgi:hypothetical protein
MTAVERAVVVAKAADTYARQAMGEGPKVTPESIVDLHFPHQANPALWHSVVSDVIEAGKLIVEELRRTRPPRAVETKVCENPKCRRHGIPFARKKYETRGRFRARKTCSPECQYEYLSLMGAQQKGGKAARAAGASAHIPL